MVWEHGCEAFVTQRNDDAADRALSQSRPTPRVSGVGLRSRAFSSQRPYKCLGIRVLGFRV